VGRNNADFQGVQYRFWDKDNARMAYASYGDHALHAYSSQDELIGRLTWDGESHGEISHISVHPEWQNNGIGTKLLVKARQIASSKNIISPEISPVRTDLGDAFARKAAKQFGMNLPDKEKTPLLGDTVGYFAKPQIDEDGKITSSNHDVIRSSIVELARRKTPIYRD
jgi:GNAT superfamily N-acetyltransferase